MHIGQDIKAASILIVDDEPVNVEILQELLEGFTDVTGISSPTKAVALYQEKDFDLILLDINMPQLNGFQVMDEFATVAKEIHPPILILTVLKDRETRLKALTKGASDFLEKPFDEAEALCRVSNLLEMHLSQKLLAKYNNTLEKTILERTRKIEKSQFEVLDCLSYAAEYRDMYTAKHTVRVGWFSRIIAEQYGFRNDELDVIQHAAPMHDIGKIGVCDTILLKKGKLDKEEFELMKLHTTIGAEILGRSNARVMKFAKTIALSHHEKWNGTGYPYALVGQKIPILGRIVALADVFDALSMKRPYKEAWPLEKILDLLSKESGEHFDPHLVKIFINSLPAILAIKEEYIDVEEN